MSKLRSLSTSFWSDPFIEDLTAAEKLLFIYLITNEKTNMLGIYEVSIKKISFETGIDKTTVENALKRFESLNKVKYIDNHIILVNFLKHQNFNTNMKKSAIDCYLNLPQRIKIQGLEIDKNNTLKAFETLCKAFGMVPKIEVELEDEEEKENEEETEEEKKDTPPEWFDFLNFAEEKAEDLNLEIDHQKLKAKYLSWQTAGWCKTDKKGKLIKIKNWKSTLLNTLIYLQKEKNSSQKEKVLTVDDLMSDEFQAKLNQYK